jgi:hypothetical protein
VRSIEARAAELCGLPTDNVEPLQARTHHAAAAPFVAPRLSRARGESSTQALERSTDDARRERGRTSRSRGERRR